VPNYYYSNQQKKSNNWVIAFAVILVLILFISIIANLNIKKVEVKGESENMTYKKPLFCRVQDLNTTFLNRIVTGHFDRFIIYTAKYETSGALTLDSGVTTAAIDSFKSQVNAKVSGAKFYAWIHNSVSNSPTTPNLSTIGARTTIINNIKTLFNTTFVGRFDGVLDDMENWAGYPVMTGRYAFVTQCAIACDSLFDYRPWMYYNYVGNITSDNLAVGMYDGAAYTEAAWKTAFDTVKNNTTATDYWIFIITPEAVGAPSIANQCSWFTTKYGSGAGYPKLDGFGVYWYYSMDGQDWIDWNNFVGQSYTITASADTHSHVSPSGYVSVTSGANQTFTYYANTGYHILQVLADGVPV
jgi:hypothetical protein